MRSEVFHNRHFQQTLKKKRFILCLFERVIEKRDRQKGVPPAGSLPK